MTKKFDPVFLKNSPSVICDQILFLVKNSNLNFEVHETPFSLNINLKKRFAHHWNRPNQSAAHNSEVHVPQHVSDPVHGHSPHYPSDGQPGQPGQLSARQTKDSLQFHNQQHHPQHRSYSPQHHALVPQVQVVPAPGLKQQQQQTNNPEIVTDPVQQNIQKIKAENLEVHKEYAELEKAHRKLSKEHKELQAKHSKVCSEVKTLKAEKEDVLKESNALSVALQSSKKNSESSFRQSMKEIEALKEELTNLNQFKIQHQEEIRKAKKLKRNLGRRKRAI